MNKEEIEDMFETLTKQWGDTDNYINDLLLYSKNLQQENKQLKDNWNKLKEKLNNEQLGYILYSDKNRFANIDELLDKIQELESGDSNE